MIFGGDLKNAFESSQRLGTYILNTSLGVEPWRQKVYRKKSLGKICASPLEKEFWQTHL